MKWYFVVLILIIALIVGFYAYRLLPFNYTPNVVPFWESNYAELDLINSELDSKNLTDERKQKLELRKKEIKNILTQFFGPNASI